MRTIAPLVALAAPMLLTALQDPGPAAGMPLVRQRINAEYMQKLEGAWRLARVEPKSGPIDAEDINGMALFADGFMSLTIHFVERDPIGITPPKFYFQSTVGQFEFRDVAELLTASLMGHGNFRGELRPEPPNYPRELRVEFQTPRDLVLTGADETRLYFTKMDKGRFPPEAQELLFTKQVRELEWGALFR